MTVFPAAERAQVRLLEQIAILAGADGDFDPNIITIGGLYNMQNAPCMDSRGEQENIIRGARQRQFCPQPRLESGRMKSFNRIKFVPITGINTAVDVFVTVGPVSAMPGVRRMARRKTLK